MSDSQPEPNCQSPPVPFWQMFKEELEYVQQRRETLFNCRERTNDKYDEQLEKESMQDGAPKYASSVEKRQSAYKWADDIDVTIGEDRSTGGESSSPVKRLPVNPPLPKTAQLPVMQTTTKNS